MKKYDAFHDWTPFVEGIIRDNNIKSVLEWGMGEGTRLFLENCESVVSVELFANPELDGWYDKCVELFRDHPAWKPYLFKCVDDYNKGTTKMYCASTLKRVNPELVFVDPGVHFRGDLVQLAMKYGVKFIVAHDTRQGFDEDDIYGWNKIDPEGYVSHTDNQIQGTTLWVKEDK